MYSSPQLAYSDAESLSIIRDSAAAFATSTGGVSRARAMRFRDKGFDRDIWAKICELGWPSLRVPESRGGLGLGMRELCAMLEQLGRHLVPEPIAQSIIIAPLLDDRSLLALTSGTSIILPAWQEQADTLLEPPSTLLEDGRVRGHKQFVYQALDADAFLLTTNAGLAFAPRTENDMHITASPTLDGGHSGTIKFSGSPGFLLPCRPEALEEAHDDFALAWSAYLLGVMETAFDMTLEYVKTRVQFDKPIGQFQVVQHRLADLMIQISLTRASLESAAASLDMGARGNYRQAVVSRAKARASDTALFVTKEAIQFHGAIGYTDECDVGLFLRKALTLANMQGSAALHRRRYAAVYPEDQDE